MKPWREIARPHQDVLEGTFKQSEFAADISAVANGSARAEYQDGEQFFARTYITEGMRDLLVSVIQRLSGKDGDPVIQLQTNFGGGKTHALLAVYHLAKTQVPAAKLAGIPEILRRAGVKELPRANVAVIDGTALAPAQPQVVGGTTQRTIWGVLAHRLLGKEGYAMVADSDAAGTSPGKDVFVKLLQKAAPCVILMDELVAFYRQLDADGLPAGSFEANMTFVQVLTESCKLVPEAVLLASLPQSENEVAGAFGQRAWSTLVDYFGRVQSVWKPVNTDESFEIVRRRLFDKLGDTAEMDETCNAFMEFYHKNREAFPEEVQNSHYLERLRRSYPVHPEVFDRLYQDWSTLAGFQRTRGVLQYLATVINRLWNDNDTGPLIMPGSLPLYDAGVRTKSTQYLAQGWEAVIEGEIDGQSSAAAGIDGRDHRFGALFAARRVARTIFFDSAPSSQNGSQARGADTAHVLLGCAQPGQQLGTYQDVIKRLQGSFHYLFAEGDRLWFDIRANLRREMESRQARIDPATARKAMRETVSRLCGGASLFAGVHVFTPHADIPDDLADGLRLVVLEPNPATAYTPAAPKETFALATDVLRHRGEQSRLHANRLAFLSPDNAAVATATELCKTMLAWQEIQNDIKAGTLNLDLAQVRQSERELERAKKVLDQSVRETYRWLLVPDAADAKGGSFKAVRLNHTAGTNLATAAAKQMLSDETAIEKWSPMGLKRLLDKYYFSPAGAGEPVADVLVSKVWHDLCAYVGMPRLARKDVLAQAVAAGIASEDFFGFAAGKETRGDGQTAYLGMIFGAPTEAYSLALDQSALLVAAPVAKEWKNRQAQTPPPTAGGTPPPAVAVGPDGQAPSGQTPAAASDPAKPRYHEFGLDISLDPLGGTTRYGDLMNEIVSVFTKKSGITVRIELSISAESEGQPFDDATVRTVKENLNALKIPGGQFA